MQTEQGLRFTLKACAIYSGGAFVDLYINEKQASLFMIYLLAGNQNKQS